MGSSRCILRRGAHKPDTGDSIILKDETVRGMANINTSSYCRMMRLNSAMVTNKADKKTDTHANQEFNAWVIEPEIKDNCSSRGGCKHGYKQE